MKAKLLSFVTIATLTACSGGSGSGGSGNGDAKARWPEVGSFSTELTYNGCTDSYSYGNKADYCTALTDETLSKCNTREMRKMAYQNDCGDDFEPRNVGGLTISGYDGYLKKQCRIDAKGPFSRIADLCANLANESLHKGCFWSDRRRNFEDWKCAGEFSPQPVAPVNPAPQPQPNPGPGPQPQPVPATPLDQMVVDFAAIGIKVDVSQVPGQHLPYQTLQAFAGTLQKLKSAFAARVSTIDHISLTAYTAYHANSGHLSLDANLSEADVVNYLNLHDQRVALTQATGVTIDMGVEIYGHESDKTSKMKDVISFFSSKSKDLKAISSVVKTIKFDTLPSLTFFDDSLELDEKSFKADFATDLPMLKKLAALGDKGVTFGKYVYLNESRAPLAKFADLLAKNSTAISQLMTITKTLEIEIDGTYDSEPRFYRDEIHVGLKTKFDEVAGLNALFTVAPVLADVGAKFEVPSYELDSDFIAATKLLAARKSVLAAKKKNIEVITVWGSGSDWSYKRLYVGAKDSLATFDKALAKIP